jgi:hypothetical protein
MKKFRLKEGDKMKWIAIIAIAFLAVFGMNNLASAFTVYQGQFGAASPYLSDAAAVADYKSYASQIAAGITVNQENFTPPEINMWPNPSYTSGGAFYVITAVTDLPATYSVTIDNNYWAKYSGDSTFWSFWDQAAYTATGPSLAGKSGTTIANWIRYSEPNGSNYNLYFGSGLDTLVDDAEHLLGDFYLRLTRDVTIKDGSGTVVFSNSYQNTAYATPLPGTLLLLGSGLAGLAFYRKRRAVLKG